MAKKQYSELKAGDKIIVFGETLAIKKIEFSGKGVKQGRAKCRVEAENSKGEQKVIIRLASEQVEVE